MKNMNKIMMILVAMLAITTAMTPAWGQTFSTTFSRCYDCWRTPEYPSRGSGTSFTVNLYNFSTDSPNWGQGVSNSSPGVWTVAYDGVYSSNTAKYSGLADDINISSFKSSSGLEASDPLPVYDLKKNGVHIAYGFLSAYANENNNHIALFIAEGWSGGYGCFLTESTTTPQEANYTFTKDLKDLSANPIPEPVVNYTLTLSSNDTQYGTVSADGAGTPNNNGTYTVPAGTQVTVKANEKPGYHFSSWSDNGNKEHLITVNSNTSLTATFAINTYTLRLNKNINDAGTVAATLTSGISGNNPYTVNHNTSVSIQATANTGYRFVNWDDNVATNPRSITVTSDVTRMANFVREYTITLSTNNNYGTVSITGTGVVDKGNGQYAVPEGNTITITATPNPGSHFVNWNGNQNLTNPSRQITVTSDQNITANFDYKIYDVPNGWTVKANNESVNVTNGTTEGIQNGKTVKITPATGQTILTVKVKNKTN